jgi:hypothetical protein
VRVERREASTWSKGGVAKAAGKPKGWWTSEGMALEASVHAETTKV